MTVARDELRQKRCLRFPRRRRSCTGRPPASLLHASDRASKCGCFVRKGAPRRPWRLLALGAGDPPDEKAFGTRCAGGRHSRCMRGRLASPQRLSDSYRGAMPIADCIVARGVAGKVLSPLPLSGSHLTGRLPSRPRVPFCLRYPRPRLCPARSPSGADGWARPGGPGRRFSLRKRCVPPNEEREALAWPGYSETFPHSR